MISADLFGDLDDDHLFVGIYGPGFGEGIIVRIPAGDEPAKWIVIDGCLINGQSPAAEILRRHGVDGADCAILTHAHLDHAKGLQEVVDMGGDGILGCADLTTEESAAEAASADPAGRLDVQVVRSLLTAVAEAWDNNPRRVWLMRREDPIRRLGETLLEVLHPDEEAVKKFGGSAARANRISGAIRLTWRGVTLLLAGDVVKPDWEEISRRSPGLNAHHLLKVPHHGSRGAQHDCFGRVAAPCPTWVATPWSRGSGLPKFVEDHGLDWLIDRNPNLYLTALPQKFEMQEDRPPYRVTAADLSAGRLPPVCGEVLPGTPGFAELAEYDDVNCCWVCAAFRPDGTLAALGHGPGSVEIVRS